MRNLAGKYQAGIYTVRIPAHNPQRAIKLKNGLTLRRLNSQEIDAVRQGIVLKFSKN